MPEINPEVLKVFGFWGSILVLKLLVMMPLTARQRIRKNAFANQEDAMHSGKGKVVYDDPDVERVRRAHLNDLENILPWFIVTYLWLGTGPSAWLAKILIRTFVLARVGHTASYVFWQQQPTRAIAFFVGFVIMGYEAVKTLMYYS
ncbi:PREDICTED: microsomal glutathione S-transferase 1-like [Trachymyrmex cornetzi]|uniref:Microsomal glutathione S-transferase 1 n=1 Tax=Trachymyrmex cornetzi TaxID=471704 RepID=A0A195E3J3_9HYME|nr:PREDICTED: microsomal glutathione S-transferase 1-like [Trachymyrmex cornetzi]KYN19449.1 Microsomal glutathione S-transferase 1 [Trachymyrmex cornetzi]